MRQSACWLNHTKYLLPSMETEAEQAENLWASSTLQTSLPSKNYMLTLVIHKSLSKRHETTLVTLYSDALQEIIAYQTSMTDALALCFSAAEYCDPIFHISEKLNDCLGLISSMIQSKPPPLIYLFVMCGILPTSNLSGDKLTIVVQQGPWKHIPPPTLWTHELSHSRESQVT